MPLVGTEIGNQIDHAVFIRALGGQPVDGLESVGWFGGGFRDLERTEHLLQLLLKIGVQRFFEHIGLIALGEGAGSRESQQREYLRRILVFGLRG